MKTTIRKKAMTGAKPEHNDTRPRLLEAEMSCYVPFEKVQIGTLNYRKYYDPAALKSFAGELERHGIIAPLVVRPVEKDRFELVVGERRYRAAKIAGFQQLPVIIKDLPDEQVEEIQMAENLQREDPHPLHEAQGIARMLARGRTIDEIAARLGKSKAFIYNRIRLCTLIDVFQDIFLAEKISIKEANELASLSSESQYEFYEAHCTDWLDDDFEMPGAYAFNRFRYDLAKAPFDIKDKSLLPEQGACTKCPLNSATLKTLFPEMAKEAICSGKDCFQRKCNAQYARWLTDAAVSFVPTAIVYNNLRFLDQLRPVIEGVDTLRSLPHFSKYSIVEMEVPEAPRKEDFSDGQGQDPDAFDEAGYNAALDEYGLELEAWQQAINEEQYHTGLYLTEKGVRQLLFTTSREQTVDAEPRQSAKAVQQAIKTGTATLELIDGEIVRIGEREQRLLELDREKVQNEIHQQFLDRFRIPVENRELTAADQLAVRLLVFKSLDYGMRREASGVFGWNENDLSEACFADSLSRLTEAQFVYLIRMALAGDPESGNPGLIRGWCLRYVAEAAGLDVTAIDQMQQAIATGRKDRMEQRIYELNRKKQKLQQPVLTPVEPANPDTP